MKYPFPFIVLIIGTPYEANVFDNHANPMDKN